MSPSAHPLVSVPVLALVLATAMPPASGAPVLVFVGAPPQKHLVERVGGTQVAVTALVRQGQDPHHFSLTPSQAVALGKADVYFATGLPFETGVIERLESARPGIPLVNLAAGFELLDDPEHGHDHGEEGEGSEHEDHAHAAGDPHIWLSPPLLKRQAVTVRDTLAALAPDRAAEFAKNTDVLHRELDALHEQTAAKLAPLRGKAFFVYHPAFGYFAQEYGLEQKAVEAGGNKPSAKRLVALAKEARESGARVIFVQPAFDTSSAQTLADQIGCRLATLDPLAADPLANIRGIADALAASIATPAP
jgi:zinc transport system substrate-binding protein